MNTRSRKIPQWLTPLALVSAFSAHAAPKTLETATFAAGCFWGSEEFFRKVPGVVDTRVGYVGGEASATYEQVSTGMTGHAESVELKFDPTKVSYRDLLVLFFKMHDPTTLNRQGNDRGTQYRSAIFTHSDTQKKVAIELEAKINKLGIWKKPLLTEVTRAGTFFPAEVYHQKFLVKHPGGYDNHYLRNLKFD